MSMRDKTLTELEDEQPFLQLTGVNGNALAIVGTCQREARRFGCSKDALEALQDEILSGDYNNVLQTAMRYFDVD